ncbi:MAG: electron transfer flavoprotein subunit alpha/FixB family protein [Polyangiaceae bacterium]|nr:electron transfer flavoprotein subunit alpha/FixB family protein [Polyangiaceae bacterium]
MVDILVIGEVSAGRLRRATGSAVAFAERIHRLSPGTTSILVAGHGIAGAVDAATGFGADRVLVVDHPALADGALEALSPTVARVAKDHGLTLATASSFGKDLLPRIAARLDAGYVADCSEVTAEGSGLVFRRAIFAGNAWEQSRIETPRGVVGVRQSEVTPLEPSSTRASPVTTVPYEPPGAARQRVEVLAFEPVVSERPDLADARAIVAGGRMLRERFFELLEPLASELGAAIGATRAACDGGWAPQDLQIGQTGKIVAPDLYVAVGISGAIQHVAGIRQARVIVAIDRDPEAPIFELADYGLVADFEVAIPELTRLLAGGRASGRA